MLSVNPFWPLEWKKTLKLVLLDYFQSNFCNHNLSADENCIIIDDESFVEVYDKANEITGVAAKFAQTLKVDNSFKK